MPKFLERFIYYEVQLLNNLFDNLNILLTMNFTNKLIIFNGIAHPYFPLVKFEKHLI